VDDLETQDMRRETDKPTLLPIPLSFRGRLHIETIEYDKIDLKNVGVEFSARNEVITLAPIKCKIFGSIGQGRAIIELNGEKPIVDATLKAETLDMEKASRGLSGQTHLAGDMDVFVHLSSKGLQPADLVKNLNGELIASGRDLILHQYDIDKILSQYEKAQDTDMIDLGALILAGPFGIALTKGFDAYEIRKGVGSAKSRITRVVSKWHISNGVASSSDVALATERNRIAVRGNLDLVNNRFDNLVVAVLDGKGCAKYSQTLRGPFSDPRLEKVEFAAQTLKSMVSSLFDKAKKMVGVREKTSCVVFYNGSVVHPGGGDS
jgi:AsmA protein